MPSKDPIKRREATRRSQQKHKEKRAEEHRQCYRANRERLLAYQKARYADDPATFRRYKLRHTYGLTIEEYDRLWKEQGGKCRICQVLSFDAPKNILYVDHCHETGKVRGLLCSHCNAGLGHFKDNSELARRAADYLDQPR